MNLSDLANTVCGTLNQTEAEDLAACKRFLGLGFKAAWNEALWKDSVVEFATPISPTGYTASSAWLPTKGIYLCPKIIERVLAVRSNQGKLNVQRPEFYYRMDFDTFAATGTATEFSLLSAAAWEFDTANEQAVTAHFADPTDVPQTFGVEYLDTDGISTVDTTVQLVANDQQLAPATGRIERCVKAATKGVVTLVAPGNFTVATAAAADQAFGRRQRIRLTKTPNTAITLRILGKRSAPVFANDLDEPALTNIDNFLIATAQGKMLERERQYGKAQSMYTAAAAFLEQLKRVETVQQAHVVRIQPECGYGDDWFTAQSAALHL